MCGIAGIIHRDGAARIGDELTAMLNSMKHRGPDSTGYAIYGPADEMFIVRFVLAEPNDFTASGMDQQLERNRAEVESCLAKIGAAVKARSHLRIIARTDAAAVEGLEGAISRSRLYVEAGADVVFPDALAS